MTYLLRRISCKQTNIVPQAVDPMHCGNRFFLTTYDFCMIPMVARNLCLVVRCRIFFAKVVTMLRISLLIDNLPRLISGTFFA